MWKEKTHKSIIYMSTSQAQDVIVLPFLYTANRQTNGCKMPCKPVVLF